MKGEREAERKRGVGRGKSECECPFPQYRGGKKKKKPSLDYVLTPSKKKKKDKEEATLIHVGKKGGESHGPSYGDLKSSRDGKKRETRLDLNRRRREKKLGIKELKRSTRQTFKQEWEKGEKWPSFGEIKKKGKNPKEVVGTTRGKKRPRGKGEDGFPDLVLRKRKKRGEKWVLIRLSIGGKKRKKGQQEARNGEGGGVVRPCSLSPGKKKELYSWNKKGSRKAQVGGGKKKNETARSKGEKKEGKNRSGLWRQR